MSDTQLAIDETSRRQPRRRFLSSEAATVVAFVTASFMGGLDSQIVNVILPTLSRDFRSPIDSIQWTILAYILALSVLIPVSGWIGDKIGTKRTFLIALAIFTLASALCGQAQNLTELVVARALQGIGAGMLTPVAMSMMWRAYPPKDRARVARIMMVPIVIGPAMAPVIGGLLVTELSWRWVFYVNIPVGVASLIFSAIHLVEHREDAGAPFDIGGFVLAGGGLGLLLYSLSEGPLVGWGSLRVLITGAVAVVCLYGFVRVEQSRHETAMLRLRLLRGRLFRATNIVNGCATGAYLGMLFLTPILIQEGRHQSALYSGLTTFCASLGSFTGTQTFGRLYPKIGPRKMETIALSVMIVLIVAMGFVGATTNFWVIRGLLYIAGISAGVSYTSAQIPMFTAVEKRDIGHGSAISQSFRQTSVAVSIAIVSTTLASVHGARFSSFHVAYFVDAIIALIGLIITVTMIRDSDARSTMQSTTDIEPAMESA